MTGIEATLPITFLLTDNNSESNLSAMAVPSTETFVAASQGEMPAKESFEDYEGQMILYYDATKGQTHNVDTHPQASPILPGTIRLDDLESQAGASGLTPEGGHWRETATRQKQSESWHKSKETLMEIGKGSLVVIAAPFAMAGLLLYGCGMILGGLAVIFKGIGGLGKLAFMEAKNHGLRVEQLV
ncbi:hypothetical protein NLJ89_g8147 [Agrocybe chaxingu]|uniref:Uncharacterized protein n=1 Tax=Agrocybe chaxingu TaxID=84603 RepID=A0A9W8JT65_9AGAR|nr:hypothetical protein NLJ89_g8147 [Agrocybe chaxingu]